MLGKRIERPGEPFDAYFEPRDCSRPREHHSRTQTFPHAVASHARTTSSVPCKHDPEGTARPAAVTNRIVRGPGARRGLLLTLLAICFLHAVI